MITPETYVKVLLKKRNITQAELLRKMKKMKLGDDNLHRQHLNKALNSKMTYMWARRIELALELPDYILVKMVGNPTEKQWELIKGVKANV